MPHTIANWRLGFLLAFSVALLWGVLPIALKLALQSLDAWTITWWRFVGAAVVLGGWLAARGTLPGAGLGDRAVWPWLLVATIGLTGNYMLYLVGLHLTSPTVAQTVIQLAPLLLLVLGVVVFRERFSPLQWIGFCVLLGGLALFFNRRLPELLHPLDGWALGILLLVIGAMSWAVYGVGQKKLLRQFSSAQVLFLMYIGAALLLLPMAQPGAVLALDLRDALALLFCVLNTVLAYGAFGLALEVWDVSRVSSVVSAAPLFALLGSSLAADPALGWIAPESLNMLSIAGALCVVFGSSISALGSRRA